MSRIDDALRDSGLTWRSGSGGDWELHGDDEVLGRLRGQVATMDGRRLELAAGRGYVALVDGGLGSRLASLRIMSHRVGHVTLPATRARISRRGFGPFRWQVTDDLGGPRLLDLTHLGGRLVIKPGPALDDHDVPADVLAIFSALVILPALREQATAA